MEGGIKISLPNGVDLSKFRLKKNISLVISDFDDVSAAETDPEYEQFLADVWVGIVLTLMVLSCVCCMCSCLLYHKFQQWKRSVLEARAAANLENGSNPEVESLPSYTIVSGLPSYEEALEQLKQAKDLTKGGSKTTNTPSVHVPAPQPGLQRLSVTELFQLYKSPNTEPTDVKT